MAPETVVSVFQCRFCGSIVTSSEAAERHKGQCRIVKLTAGKALSAAGKLTVVVKFPCPVVLIERLNNSPPPVLTSECTEQSEAHGNDEILGRDKEVKDPEPAPPVSSRRKSSLNALKKLKLLQSSDLSTKDGRMKPDDDDEETNWDMSDEYRPNLRDDRDFSTSIDKPRRRRKAKAVEIKKSSGLQIRRRNTIKKIFFGLRCSRCPALFNLQDALDHHEFVIHGEGSKGHKIITCPICGRMFNSALGFHAHIKNHENAEAIEDAFDLWNKWPENTANIKNKFSVNCKHCVIPLRTHECFLGHMRQDHPDKERQPTYSCKYCLEQTGSSDEFISMKVLILHFRRNHRVEFHIGDKKGIPVECDVCGKTVVDVYYLKLHKRRRHATLVQEGRMRNIQKPSNQFVCLAKGCHAKLKSQGQLKMHFILHLKNNPYACPIDGCKVKTDARCHLIRHVKLHFESPIPCEVCGLHFSRKDKLKTHKCDPQKHSSKGVGGHLRRSRFAHLRLVRPKVGNLNVVPVKGQSYQGNLEEKKDNQAEMGSAASPEITDLNSILEKLNRRIDIRQIIASDPVFIEVCKENPDFEELVLGTSSRTSKPRTTIRQFQCEKCKMTFSSAKCLKKHDLKMHVPRPFKCSKCQMTYTSEAHLEKHVLKWHSHVDDNYMIYLENEGRFKCTKCGAVRVNELSLRRHWFLIHKIKVAAATTEVTNKTKTRLRKVTKVKQMKRFPRKQKRKKYRHEDDDDEDDPDWFNELFGAYKDEDKKETERNLNESVPIIKVEVPELNIEVESASDIKLELTSDHGGDVIKQENIVGFVREEMCEIDVKVETFGNTSI